jgi:CubicO group peptidase (beta-lactamase class C family)/ketosteroid isomerase-like protein
MSGNARLVALALLSSCTFTPAVAQVSAPAPLHEPRSIASQAEAMLVGAYPSDGPGATAIVTLHGQPIFSGARGLADMSARKPLEPDSVIRMGSLTKQLTSAVLLQLVDEGRVSLDDPLSKYLPDFPAPGRNATIRQLLDHTSGIQSYTAIPGFMTEANTARVYTTGTLIAVFRDKPSISQPGTQWAYNNSGYVLAGAIVEAVTGKPWYQAIEERLTGPLGLASIRYGDATPTAGWASGYTVKDGMVRPAQKIDMSAPQAAGGLVGSVGDFARWTYALHHGRILKPATYAQMIAPTKLPDGTTKNYGFGLEIGAIQGARTFEHSGGIFGATTEAIYLPDQDVFVGVFANSDAPATDPNVLARRLAALAIGKPYPSFTATRIDLEALRSSFGLYRADQGGEHKFFARDGRLFLQDADAPAREVFAAGDDRFFFGPGHLEWLRLVRASTSPPVIEYHTDGGEKMARATWVGPFTSSSDEQSVRDADASFWRAFNACDAQAMAPFFTDDVEFYHDITGLTRSRDAVVASMMKGPCGTPGLHMRRAIVASSVKFNPVPGFGAVLVGQHLFYERHGDGPEKPATLASFMIVWKLQSGRWLMTRIVSYDHQPVPYTPPSARIAVPPGVLERYVGTYHTAGSGDIDVTLEDGGLKLHSGGLRVTLAASAPDRFFALERDLRFTFSETADSFALAVEENGAIVATGTRPKSQR